MCVIILADFMCIDPAADDDGVCLSVCLFVSLSLSLSLFVSVCVCVCVCLCVCKSCSLPLEIFMSNS